MGLKILKTKTNNHKANRQKWLGSGRSGVRGKHDQNVFNEGHNLSKKR